MYILKIYFNPLDYYYLKLCESIDYNIAILLKWGKKNNLWNKNMSLMNYYLFTVHPNTTGPLTEHTDVQILIQFSLLWYFNDFVCHIKTVALYLQCCHYEGIFGKLRG